MSKEQKEQTKVAAPPIVDTGAVIDQLVANAQVALSAFMSGGYNQEKIDNIVHAMATAGLAAHMELAQFAVDETGRGVFEDKIIKNIFSTEYVYNNIKNLKTVDVIEDNEYEDCVSIAEPVGVLAAVTPVTNPTSTTMFKIIIAIKARNPIIFGFHPSAQNSSAAAAKVLYDAAIKAGAPENCIQWIDTPSIEATNALMNHDGIAVVLATGGSAMVKAAYSTGKPALGVGPGNVPCYIHKSADLKQAATDLMLSKTFDYGMVCASEQAVIVDREIAADFEKFMKENNCYFCNEDEIEKLSATVIKPNGAVNANIVGKSPNYIAELAGIKAPKETKILIAHVSQVGAEVPLSREKLSPVLAYFIVDSAQEGIDKAEQMLEFGGLGHSAVIHAADQDVIAAFSMRMKACRVMVNSPTSQGAIGDIYNTIVPSLTLGCGSYGRNSISENVSTVNLLNIKRVAKRRKNMQWFKVPQKIFFEFESTQYLAKMEGISRVFIVTDPAMVQFNYVDKILYYLGKRKEPVQFEVFADVEPDPSIDTIMRGVEAMQKFQPDCIISFGGGSAMDAAKGMWLFYEYPETNFKDLTLKFLDIRKRVVEFPKMGKKAKMVAIPTTSGTGSEVTSFAVISDHSTNMKYPLADYELTPDVAIIDPSYAMTVPKSITADTGMDVLTHAIESYVSIMSNDYTDGLAIKATQLVFKWLKLAYDEPNNREAREHMHNASCIAGMSFTNAFLGVNHSLAHKLGSEFHIPHGRANAILLPHVIAYNAQKPTKFVSFPKYNKYIADERYAELARAVGLKADTTKEGVDNLIAAIRDLMTSMNVPMTISECGIDKKTYFDALPALSMKAFGDQCTTANPRYPLAKELEQIYHDIY